MGGSRAAEDGVAVADQLSPGYAGEDAVDQAAVGPGRVLDGRRRQRIGAYVDAAQVEPAGDAGVEFAVQGGQGRYVGRAGGDGDQVEVAYAGHVVAGGQGARDQQVGYAAERLQPRAERRNRLHHSPT
jgi:hypothetical protein